MLSWDCFRISFKRRLLWARSPHTGEFVVGVGWNEGGSKRYIERCGGAGRAVDMFRAAWQGKPLDFSGFEDQSDRLPGDS